MSTIDQDGEVREMQTPKPSWRSFVNAAGEDCRWNGSIGMLFNPDLYLRAYGRIYRNAGAMTPGVTRRPWTA